MTQAVFSLRGKPQNSYGLSKKIVYENEEFNLLQAALNIEDDIENLRYNKIVMATDADVDGMHIRMLLLAFFLQFFPLMDHSPLDSRQPHSGQGVDVVADKVHLHGITAFLRS